MKYARLISLLMCLFFISTSYLSYAGSSAPLAAEKQVKTKKEIKREKRLQKLNKFITKRIEKKLEKKKKNRDFGDLDRNAQLAILFGVAATALLLVSLIINFLWILAVTAWVIGIVFFVLWAVDNYG